MVEVLSDQVKQLMQKFYEGNPYVKLMGIELEEVLVGSVRLSMLITPERHINAYHIAHGGTLMSLADTAMGASCLTMDKKVVTLDMNINCMKAAPEGQTVFAVGKILHDGARTIVAECEITDQDGRLCAKARGTFYVTEKFAK